MVHEWKRGEVTDTGLIERQAGYLVPRTLSGEIALWGVWQRQFAKSMLNDCLPEGDYTQRDFIPRVTNAVSPACRQSCVPTDEPEENVRIEQEFHEPSNAFRRSSGRGASKSSGTLNSPAQSPNGRSVSAG